MLVALHDVLGGEHADGEGVHEDVGDHVLAVPRLGLDEVRVVAVGLHERVLRGEARALEELLHGLLGAVEALGHEPVAVVLVAVLAPRRPVHAPPVAPVCLGRPDDLLGEGGEARLAGLRDLARLLQALRERLVLEALWRGHAVRRARVVLVVHEAGAAEDALLEYVAVLRAARSGRVPLARPHEGDKLLPVLLEDVGDEVGRGVDAALGEGEVLVVRDDVREALRRGSARKHAGKDREAGHRGARSAGR
mmetsp:Transcript_35443/g.80530  ORF Transcript_35443/g.80530 Transcript_35443/m.80530 type:complete len:250 (-) Transcript_35443:29-778(-)